MDNPRFPLEEFKSLLPDRFESQERLVSEYHSFLMLLEQLDRVPVPQLSARQKADIFRRSWQGRPQGWSWAWLALLRRPAVTFAMGIVLGCSLMFTVARTRAAAPQPASPPRPQPLAVERAGRTQIYSGTLVDGLYPQIENPKIVVERLQKSSAPQRVLYGTLDQGQTYVVWNL
ncbi:MAG: hypothetical protein JW955_05965 [Sedimentisphaerales bacterium]|nr:hypothetical protein [Sedimentisphaerales bacterium]